MDYTFIKELLRMKKILSCAVALAFSVSANATLVTESFTGNLDHDDARYYITFDVTQNNTLVDLTTWSFAGGINAAGLQIADGGFDTQLALFNNAGQLIDSDDDASSVSSGIGGSSWDAIISNTLTIGSYTAVLTQYNSDYQSGDLITGNWTSSGKTNFDGRSSFYAFDISGENLANVGGVGHDTTPTDVPEPSSIALFGLMLVGLAGRRKFIK